MPMRSESAGSRQRGPQGLVSFRSRLRREPLGDVSGNVHVIGWTDGLTGWVENRQKGGEEEVVGRPVRKLRGTTDTL